MPMPYILGEEAMHTATRVDCLQMYGEYIGGFESEDLDIPNSKFDQVMFCNIKFSGADFSSTSFDSATFEDITFVNCDFSFCDFTNTELINVTFTGCKLNDVEFTSASLETVHFTNCHGEVDFTDASFTACSFSGCDFEHSSLFDAHLENVSFSKCNLTKCRVSSLTNLHSVSLDSCDITELHISRCRRTNFYMCNSIYRPYLFSSPGIFTVLSNNNRTTTYSLNYSCHVYCSSVEELNQVGKR